MSPGKINLYQFACSFSPSPLSLASVHERARLLNGTRVNTLARRFLVPPVFYLVRSFTVHVIIFIGFHASTISVSSTPAKWIAIFAGLNWRTYFRAGDRSIGKPITNIFAKTEGEKHGGGKGGRESAKDDWSMLFGFFVVIKRIKNSFFLFFFSSSQTFFLPPVESPIAWWSTCARISTFPFRVGREKKDRYLMSGCFVNWNLSSDRQIIFSPSAVNESSIPDPRYRFLNSYIASA